MKVAGWILSFVLFIAVIFMWQCPDNTVTSKADELEQKLKVLEDSFKLKDDSTRAEIAARDSIIVDLTAEKEILSGELKVVGDQVTDLARRVRHARVIRDTVEFFLSCDSLVSVALEQSELINQYQHTTDSLITAYKAQSSSKDSMIVARDRLLGQVRGAFNVLADENRSLAVQINREKKKHKFSKKLNIVLGATVVVLGGILIAK